MALGVYLLLGVHLILAVIAVTVKIDEPEERECYGTTVGLGYSGTLEFHYHHLKKRYAGCTHIHGNLELTNLVDPKLNYDLSFLKSIRYVSGYILIGLVTEVEIIPFDSLEVIRGNNTYSIMGDEYSLVVVLSSRNDEKSTGLKELHLPQLKEISMGKVLFTRNPFLGFINTIDWEPILRGRWENVHFLESAYDETAADNNDTSICDKGTRWGNDKSLCQKVSRSCHESCDGRCFGPSDADCCHATCAVGCDGAQDQDCIMCKDYLYESRCVGFCPAKSYPKLQYCVRY
ncbi:epidermal growth factor receptor-like isoform X2 [Physella acuta]|uniref:epidermal growth factor receptor-like isoform X2 n=1 Tax=Physella acuta TaxID=109671 RepID=UPI0027DD0A60|nr:epidermal growth factor receptor-like isoform X2 [Physella acuta]